MASEQLLILADESVLSLSDLIRAYSDAGMETQAAQLANGLAELERKAALADRIMDAVDSDYPVDWAAIIREWNTSFQPVGAKRGE